MLAFLAFCRGLDLSDQGRYKEAEAVQLDAGGVSDDAFVAMIENVTEPETENERVVRLEQIEDSTVPGQPRGGGEAGLTPGAGPNVEVRVLIPNVEIEAEF